MLFLQKLNEAFDTHTFPYIEIEVKRQDERELMALMHGALTTDSEEDKVCRICIQDINELKKVKALKLLYEALQVEMETVEHSSKTLEEKVLEHTKELSMALEAEKRINELKSSFISIASHELRTPITIISTSVALMQRYHELKQYKKEQRLIDRIRLSANQFAAILDDLLSLDKMERRDIRVNKQSFDLRKFIVYLIRDLRAMLKPEQQIYHIHEGVRKIVSDIGMLKHILSNLLSNAMKYSDSDIGLHSSLIKSQLTITVTDKGMGIPMEDQQYLFIRFFRAKNVENIQGTGLGLSIVERYLDLMDGKIEFTSQLNEGSKFTITIPEVT